MLDLKRPIYRQTAAYGHMGRTDIDLPWERLDKVDALKRSSQIKSREGDFLFLPDKTFHI